MKTNTVKTLIVSAIIVAVGGLTLGYAALTQQLTVNTSAKVQNSATSWKIVFQNKSTATVTGDAVAGTLTLTDTTVDLSGVVLKAPGDSVSYTFEVANNGEIDAKISSIVNSGPTITGTGTNASTDQTLISNNYVYTLTYDGGTVVSQNDVLNKKTKKVLRLTVSLKSSMSSLPSNDVTVTAQKTTINYVQN